MRSVEVGEQELIDRYGEGVPYALLRNYLLEVYPEKDIIQRIL